MIIGLDFDGVLCKDRKLSLGIFYLFVFLPKEKGTEIVRLIGGKCELIVITSRPRFFEWISRLWFILHRIPIRKIYHVGNGDKTPILLRERVDVFFDNNMRHIEAARKRGVNAYLFKNWNETMRVVSSLSEGGI